MKLQVLITLTFISLILQGRSQAIPDTLISPYLYIYNNGRDSLHLSPPTFYGFYSFTKYEVKDSVQVDGKGKKEIIIYRQHHGEVSDHGGTFDIVEDIRTETYEVWNLDTKEQLFYAMSSYSIQYNNFDIYSSPPQQNGFCSYAYDFSIDTQGTITVANSRTSAKTDKSSIQEVSYSGLFGRGSERHCTPDHPEDTYTFINGHYYGSKQFYPLNKVNNEQLHYPLLPCVSTLCLPCQDSTSNSYRQAREFEKLLAETYKEEYALDYIDPTKSYRLLFGTIDYQEWAPMNTEIHCAIKGPRSSTYKGSELIKLAKELDIHVILVANHHHIIFKKSNLMNHKIACEYDIQFYFLPLP